LGEVNGEDRPRLGQRLYPEQFASGFIEALKQGGLSEEDAVRTVAAFVNLGNCFSFVDRRNITAALAATYPDWPMPDSLFPDEARPEATVPPGGVMVSCYDVLDPDMLVLARSKRKDPTWLPCSAFDVPIECNVEANVFVIDSPGVTGEHDTLRVTGTMELFFERTGEERRTLTSEHLASTEAVGPGDRGLVTDVPSSQIHVPRSVFPLPDDARLIRGPDGMPGELSLPADRTHILLLGATWCGPCHDLAPSVEAFIAAIAGRDNAPVVHRLSIDHDPDSFDAALAAYPSGICTDAFKEDFAVDVVPKYYLIGEGKLVEQGIVSEERLVSWRESCDQGL
jgi:thiol-disulfide isomerase/thioredoxin